MVSFSTEIPECDSHSPALLDLFISFDANICSTMAFPLLGNSNHVVVLVSVDFRSNSQQVSVLYRVAYAYSHADWDGLCDNLRDIPWDDIFKVGASVAASEFCEWIQVGIDVYTPHREYQIKSHSSLTFSAACAAAIICRKHFFVCIKTINLLILKKSSDRLVIIAKGFLKLPNLRMLIKQKSPSLPRNLALRTFGKLLIVFSAKANLLYFLY